MAEERLFEAIPLPEIDRPLTFEGLRPIRDWLLGCTGTIESDKTQSTSDRTRKEGEVIGVDCDVGNLDVHDPEKKTVKSFSTLIGNDRCWYKFPVYVETLVSPHLNNVAA
ncbi:hypothetical protein NL676_023494 [Syzygium grande]|nr:hypothetical protein NL676_023494 [Syzygium grande]